MNKKLISAAMFSVLVGMAVASSPAEARRLFWWQSDPAYDVYGDPDVLDEFNQEQYDLYMQQMKRKKRLRYDQSYYDPQLDDPDYEPPPPRKVKKKKTVKTVAVAKPKPAAKSVVNKPASPQVASISKRFDEPAPEPAKKGVDCGKGASIVAGFGFSGVTTKSCTGTTFVYGATRSGKTFEVQVSAASGELTAVKKL
jgi:hypothetical protein